MGKIHRKRCMTYCTVFLVSDSKCCFPVNWAAPVFSKQASTEESLKCSLSSMFRNLSIRKKASCLQYFLQHIKGRRHLGNSCCRFFGLSGRVLEVVLPNVSPVSLAGIFGGQESELGLCSGVVCGMPAAEIGETLGRKTSRTQPDSPENPQQPSDPGRESLREYI